MRIFGDSNTTGNVKEQGQDVARTIVGEEVSFLGKGTPDAPEVGDIRISPGGDPLTPPATPPAETSGGSSTPRIQYVVVDRDLNLAPNGAWQDCDQTGTVFARHSDIVIPGVVAGDYVEFGCNYYHSAPDAAGGIFLDAWTVVNGVPKNKFHKLIADHGPPEWGMYGGQAGAVVGTAQYRVTAADIENGMVRIRPRYAAPAQPNVIIFGTYGFTINFFGNGPFKSRPQPQLVFDGQSFNFAPTDGRPYPLQTLALLQGAAFGSIVGMSGTTYAQRVPSAAYRTDSVFRNAEVNVVLDAGGVSDIWHDATLGGNMTAAQTIAAAESYATNRKNAGADYVIGFTVTPSTIFNATSETRRNEYNNRVRNSTVFDAVVDQAAIPQLSDPMNTTYYYDQLHPTQLGASLIAAEAVEAIQSLGVL